MPAPALDPIEVVERIGTQLADPEKISKEILRNLFQIPPSLNCSDWADAYRRVIKGPEKGPWRTHRTPYLREPMNCTDAEHPAQKIVLMFATQLGKSEVLYNAILKRIHLAPQDILFVQPTLQDAKDHSRQRFTPTVRMQGMEHVAHRLPSPTSRQETNTWQTKEIKGGATLFFAGANSARSLASKPLGFACLDEIDGYPLDVDGEGDPMSLVWERMSNFRRRKLIVSSTPTIKDFSRIEAEYLASDMRDYWVPCPHCGEYQVLEWGAETKHGLKWEKTENGAPIPQTAHYVCRHHGGIIDERHKTDMLEAGEWRALKPDAQRGLVAGFRLNKLYSPLGWKSWAMLVEDWAAARAAQRAGDNSRLKTFVNTSLAQTWEMTGDRVGESDLIRRAADIPLRIVHWGMLVCTMGVDTQGDRLEASIWAWGRGMERQLVDRVVLYGDPTAAEEDPGSVWSQLTEYRNTPVFHASGRPSPVLAVFIDSGGHATNAVYAYCRAHQREHVHAVKGASIAGRPILGKPNDVDVTWRGSRIKRGVKMWPIGTDTAKAEIYGRLRIAHPGPGYVWISKHHKAETFEQLTSETMITRHVHGHARLEWRKHVSARNEELDKAVYALAAAHYVGIDRWAAGDWAKWQGRVGGDDLHQTVAQPAPIIETPPVAVLIQPPPRRKQLNATRSREW